MTSVLLPKVLLIMQVILLWSELKSLKRKVLAFQHTLKFQRNNFTNINICFNPDEQ